MIHVANASQVVPVFALNLYVGIEINRHIYPVVLVISPDVG